MLLELSFFLKLSFADTADVTLVATLNVAVSVAVAFDDSGAVAMVLRILGGVLSLCFFGFSVWSFFFFEYFLVFLVIDAVMVLHLFGY